MGAVNFYLKKPSSSGKSLIYLQYKFNGNKLTFTFSQSIAPRNWNKLKQRVKNNNYTISNGKYSLNDLLDKLQSLCEKTYNKEIKNGIPHSTIIKSALTHFINQQNGKPNYENDFFELAEKFTSGEIKYNGKTKSRFTLANYKTTVNALTSFSKDMKYPLFFNSINLDFYNKFTDYLEKKGISENTIGRYFKDIKTFMSEAADRNLTSNFVFKTKKFKSVKLDSDSVYLTEQEILILHNYKLEDPKLMSIRDLFVFGCYVGLRFSDYNNIQPENIVKIEGDFFIKLVTQKTGDLVIIPCNDIVLEIFDRYQNNNNKLPKPISNQKFNSYIKDIARIAGLDEIGRLSTNPSLKLYECISSHTARRSFATNFYLQGFPTIDLMKITGHKTEKAFMKYIKVTKLDSAKRLSSHMKKNWNDKILKAV